MSDSTPAMLASCCSACRRRPSGPAAESSPGAPAAAIAGRAGALPRPSAAIPGTARALPRRSAAIAGAACAGPLAEIAKGLLKLLDFLAPLPGLLLKAGAELAGHLAVQGLFQARNVLLALPGFPPQRGAQLGRRHLVLSRAFLVLAHLVVVPGEVLGRLADLLLHHLVEVGLARLVTLAFRQLSPGLLDLVNLLGELLSRLLKLRRVMPDLGPQGAGYEPAGHGDHHHRYGQQDIHQPFPRSR